MSWSDLIAELQPVVTPEVAREVRTLRVERRLTWRGVADAIYETPAASALTEFTYLKGHQQLGEYLCLNAARVLNEDPDKEPWN